MLYVLDVFIIYRFHYYINSFSFFILALYYINPVHTSKAHLYL